MKNTQNQRGFAHLLLVLLVLIVAVGAAGFFVLNKDKEKETKQVTSENAVEVAKESKVTIKNLGINLDYYDPATNMAGDIEFTKAKFEEGTELMFVEYGYEMPGNSANGYQAKRNPQPTFILPLGTKVQAIVDGTVFDVPKLYSNDYSVRIQAEGSDLIFEMEHVINPNVKQGDKVKAGDTVAEVSDYSAKSFGGYGLVEFGVLQGGNPPKHLCLFDYLDESIKDDTFKKITALKKSWEEYRGDTTLYDETKEVVPGCIDREPIEG